MKGKKCPVCGASTFMFCNTHGVWKIDCKCNSDDKEWKCSQNFSHTVI